MSNSEPRYVKRNRYGSEFRRAAYGPRASRPLFFFEFLAGGTPAVHRRRWITFWNSERSRNTGTVTPSRYSVGNHAAIRLRVRPAGGISASAEIWNLSRRRWTIVMLKSRLPLSTSLTRLGVPSCGTRYRGFIRSNAVNKRLIENRHQFHEQSRALCGEYGDS